MEDLSMSGVNLSSPPSCGVLDEQFGVRRAVRIAAGRRGVPFYDAESVAMKSMADQGDRSVAIEAGFQYLRDLGASRELTA
jgi:hypothetical protein